jgi:hypothetical protein
MRLCLFSIRNLGDDAPVAAMPELSMGGFNPSMGDVARVIAVLPVTL